VKVAVLIALLLPLSGCVSELISPTPMTTRRFACDALGDVHLTVVVHIEPGLDFDPGVAVGALVEELARISPRDSSAIARSFKEGPGEPVSGWDDVALRGLANTAVDARDGLRLHVYWLRQIAANATGSLGSEVTGRNIAPGVVVVAQRPIESGATRLNASLDEIATAVLLHYVGHALGAVNNGIPVQDVHIERRENPPKHEAATDSVMHASWHAPATMRNITAQYSDAQVQDWQAAREPAGVCL
jgi:hypothetical protein